MKAGIVSMVLGSLSWATITRVDLDWGVKFIAASAFAIGAIFAALIQIEKWRARRHFRLQGYSKRISRDMADGHRELESD